MNLATLSEPLPWMAFAAHRMPARLTAPLALQLDAAMGEELPQLLRDHADAVQMVRRLLDRLLERDDANDRTQVEVLVRGMRQSLRERVAWHPAGPFDRAVRSDMREIMDMPWSPQWLHDAEMRWLDKLNIQLGSYARWRDLVLQTVANVPWARIEDVAAGSGGFVRWMARHSPRQDLHLSCSDYAPGYVAMGEKLAAGQSGLPVRCHLRDATQLASLHGQVDLITCTQSTHHLPPGLIVQLIHQALAVAPCGVVLVDVLRSFGNVLGAWLATTLSTPALPLTLDGMQSARRGLLPSELKLYAELAGAAHSDTQAVGPAFAVLYAHN